MDETEKFVNSYNDCSTYPTNLVYDQSRLKSQKYKKEVDKHEQSLFTTDPDDAKSFIVVLIRDYGVVSQDALTRRNIKDEDSLRLLFGGKPGPPSPLLTTELKPDPKCRFILLETPYPGARRLNLTRAMLMRILSYHQVPSCYLNFLTFLSSTTSAADLGFGGFRVESSLVKPRGELSKLDRSGRRIQLCYTLGTLEDDRPIIEGSVNRGHRWVRPHASIHHQFDLEKGTMLWIITAPVTPQSQTKNSRDKSKIWTDDFKKHIEESHLDRRFQTPESCFAMSLDIHLKLAAWSIGDFSYYMQDTDERVRKLTEKYIDVQAEKIEEADLRLLYILMDRTEEYRRCLESNRKVLQSIAEFYENRFLKEVDCISWKKECTAEIDRFLYELKETMSEIEGIVNRTAALKSLAELRESVITKLLQNQTNDRIYKLTKQGHEEAVSVSLFQKIAFIYLPITVVSAVFSTDIIKFQPDLEPGQTHSWSAMAFVSWFVVTLVLTLLTLFVSELWRGWESRRLQRVLDLTEADIGAELQPGSDSLEESQDSPSTGSHDSSRGLIRRLLRADQVTTNQAGGFISRSSR